MAREYNVGKDRLLEAVLELSGIEEGLFGPRQLTSMIGMPTIVNPAMGIVVGEGVKYEERHAIQDLQHLVHEGILVRKINRKGRTRYAINPDKIIEDEYLLSLED